MFRFQLLLSLVFVAASPIFAQDAIVDAAPLAPAADAAESDQHTDPHTAAVEELLSVMKMEETAKSTMDQMLQVQLRNQPQLAPFKEVMENFFAKHLSYASLKPDLVKLYKAEFTADELNQLAEFYRTPVGKKAIEKLPKLAAAGAQLGMQRVQKNMGELQAAIAKRSAELQNPGQ